MLMTISINIKQSFGSWENLIEFADIMTSKIDEKFKTVSNTLSFQQDSLKANVNKISAKEEIKAISIFFIIYH